MRPLPFKIKLLFGFKCVLFDFTFTEEWHGEFAPTEVQSRLDQVNAALMSLEVVQTEQQINLVVFEHGERALDGLIASDQVHICQVNSAQDLRLAHTDSHSRKPSIKLVKQIALLGTLLADNRALGATVHEGLHRVTIDLRVDVEHRDIAEKLGVVLHGLLVVRANHLLPNLFLDHLLRLNIVRIGVPHLHLALLLGLLFRHDLFKSLRDQFFNLGVVA